MSCTVGMLTLTASHWKLFLLWISFNEEPLIMYVITTVGPPLGYLICIVLPNNVYGDTLVLYSVSFILCACTTSLPSKYMY